MCFSKGFLVNIQPEQKAFLRPTEFFGAKFVPEAVTFKYLVISSNYMD
jgi:hypothetical protein